MAYFLLFLSSFASATVLPFSSEALFYTLLQMDKSPLWLLLAATSGNSLGGITSWVLGRFLLRFRDRRWFYASDAQLDRGQQLFQHFGLWSLLFTWLPLVGDVLCVAAGVLKVRAAVFIPLMTIGKACRYGALLWLV